MNSNGEPRPSDAVVEEWGRRVMVEFNSAQLTAQLHDFLLQVGASERLLKLCSRVLSDEIRHAKDCLESLETWGVDLPITVDQVCLASALPELQRPIQTIVGSFVIGETAAVPLFGRMRVYASNPRAAFVLDGIIRDEKVHRGFAWKVLDELLSMESSQKLKAVCGIAIPHVTLHSYIQSHIHEWILGMYRFIERGKQEVKLPEKDAGYGLLDGATYYAIWLQCYRDQIRPMFEDRGFDVPKL